MCSPTHSQEIPTPSALHLYHFTFWPHYLFLLSLQPHTRSVHKSRLTFTGVEGLQAEHFWRKVQRTSRASAATFPDSVPSKWTVAFFSDLSVSRWIFAFFPHYLCSRSTLSFKHVTLLRSIERESPPTPPPRLLRRSEPPSIIIPLSVCLCESLCTALKCLRKS